MNFLQNKEHDKTFNRSKEEIANDPNLLQFFSSFNLLKNFGYIRKKLCFICGEMVFVFKNSFFVFEGYCFYFFITSLCKALVVILLQNSACFTANELLFFLTWSLRITDETLMIFMLRCFCSSFLYRFISIWFILLWVQIFIRVLSAQKFNFIISDLW